MDLHKSSLESRYAWLPFAKENKLATKPPKPEWAVNLSKALDTWCLENGYRVKTMLADELEIPRKEWDPISAGDSIVSNVESYAKIFQKTGLAEADPRSIAPRHMYIPKTGQYMDKSRAWTEEEWQTWLSNQSKPSEPRPVVGQNSSSTPTVPESQKVINAERPKTPEGAFPTAGNIVDQLVNALGHQIAQVIREDLWSMGATGSREEDAGRLMVKLTGKLKDMHAATREERELFIGRYGIQLGNLHAVLDPFIRDPDDRERAVELGERFV